ncbi:serine hydrolase [Streptomyces sp. NPDC051322]|uniref:serine hydrolase n=1 Tax=Streptomyces sp. NPDC051322 TaxID=3154645 RepID=UPI00344ED0CE
MHRSPLSSCALRGLTAAVAAGTLLTAAGPASASDIHAATTVAGGSKVVCASNKPGLAPKLSRDIANALKKRHGTSALALYDRRSGTSCTLNAGKHFDSASVVKVTVLGALLRRAEEAHRKLTPHEVKLTTAMITKSDNDSTSALWREVGVAGVKHFLSLAKMRQTTPGADGSWGLTQITAADEVTLMRLLTTENAVLSASARGYALGLMKRVVPEQRWGVPTGAPTTATAHVKNGWLQRATDGWRVHSVGAFTGGGHDYGMAVLSQGNHTMGYGVATIEGASRVIHRDLDSAVTTTGG